MLQSSHPPVTAVMSPCHVLYAQYTQGLLLQRSAHGTGACSQSLLESSQMFAEELSVPHSWVSSAAALQPTGSACNKGPDGAGNPQLSVILRYFFWGQEKTSWVFGCKPKSYCTKHLILHLMSREKSDGKVGTHPDKHLFWHAQK